MYRPIAQLSLPTLSADTLQRYKRARWLMSVKIGKEVEGLLRYLPDNEMGGMRANYSHTPISLSGRYLLYIRYQMCAEE